MNTKQQFIIDLDNSRAHMNALVNQVDARQELYPTWTIKEILAHIAGWDDATTASLQAHAIGQKPSTPASRGIDAYNAETVATRTMLKFEQVVKEWQVSRDLLKAVIAELPEERLDVPMVFPWGQVGTVAQIIDIMAEHEEEHAEEIAQIIADAGQ